MNRNIQNVTETYNYLSQTFSYVIIVIENVLHLCIREQHWFYKCMYVITMLSKS